VPTGTNLVSTVTGTLLGTDAGFVNANQHDVHLTVGSLLRGKGALPTTSPSGHPFPSPLAAPAFNPPLHTVDAPGQATPRPASSKVAIGAYEVGSQTTPVPADAGTPVGSPQDPGSNPGTGGGEGTGGGGGTGAGGGGSPGSGGGTGSPPPSGKDGC